MTRASHYLNLLRIRCWKIRWFRRVVGIGARITLRGWRRREADLSVVGNILRQRRAMTMHGNSPPLTLFVIVVGSVVAFFSAGNDGLTTGSTSGCFCRLIFMSLFRRFTFCPSICSSSFGVRFRRTLSVVESFFAEWWFVVDSEPNKRNGAAGLDWKSSNSLSGSVGWATSCCEKF